GYERPQLAAAVFRFRHASPGSAHAWCVPSTRGSADPRHARPDQLTQVLGLVHASEHQLRPRAIAGAHRHPADAQQPLEHSLAGGRVDHRTHVDVVHIACDEPTLQHDALIGHLDPGAFRSHHAPQETKHHDGDDAELDPESNLDHLVEDPHHIGLFPGIVGVTQPLGRVHEHIVEEDHHEP